MSREKTFQIIRTAVAMAAAVLVAFIIILAVSDSPLESIRIFLVKPFSSLRYIGNIIETATPLIFSGLAMAVLFRSNLFNLGGEGVSLYRRYCGILGGNLFTASDYCTSADQHPMRSAGWFMCDDGAGISEGKIQCQ